MATHVSPAGRPIRSLWKGYTSDWDLHQLRHTAISLRAAHDYTEVDLKRFSGHTSLRSLERYIADNREAAKRKAREWERRQRSLWQLPSSQPSLKPPLHMIVSTEEGSAK